MNAWSESPKNFSWPWTSSWRPGRSDRDVWQQLSHPQFRTCKTANDATFMQNSKWHFCWMCHNSEKYEKTPCHVTNVMLPFPPFSSNDLRFRTPGAMVIPSESLLHYCRAHRPAARQDWPRTFPAMHQIHGWLVVGPPLWKILVNWDDYSQYMGK